MTLTYIFHSGFALETDEALLIFDYWMDPACVVPRLLNGAKRVYVFSSHFHEDHFSREILEWKSKYPAANFSYILSKDILRHRRAQRAEADAWMGKGAEWDDGYLHVIAAGSNDSGVSWIVDVEGHRIFHAGDLNNWYARFLATDTPDAIIHSTEFDIDVNPLVEEKRYLGELKDIRRALNGLDAHPTRLFDFDLVMFPIDGRIGNGYTRGARQFVKQFSVHHFVPMHFVAAGFESAWRMAEYIQPPSCFWSIEKEGDTYMNFSTDILPS